MFDLSVCAIVKDEAPNLIEWIEFHSLVGVRHFYIYDNASSDNTVRILEDFQRQGKVTLYQWPKYPGQVRAFYHALRNHGPENDWMAFIDVDEFLFPTSAEVLQEVLPQGDVGGLGVNWLIFGSSGFDSRPPGLTIENYTKRAADDFAQNLHIKSIVRPKCVDSLSNPHYFNYRSPYYCVTEENQKVSGPITARHSVKNIRINHYFTRSHAEMEEKILKPAPGGRRRDSTTVRLHDRNEVEDRTILRFLPRLKKRIDEYWEEFYQPSKRASLVFFQDPPLKESVLNFLRTKIETARDLQVLAVLAHSSPLKFSEKDISNKLPELQGINDSLETLVKHKVILKCDTDPPTFQYPIGTLEDDFPVLEALSACLPIRPEVEEAIAAKTMNPIRAFSSAFNLKKDKR